VVIPVTDSFPDPTITLAGGVAALELLVVLFHEFVVLFAILFSALAEVRAARISA
jgi:hypothetical protein